MFEVLNESAKFYTQLTPSNHLEKFCWYFNFEIHELIGARCR